MQMTVAPPITRQDLCAIARRARTLDERLADAGRNSPDAFSEQALERWRRAAGGADKLRRRLAASGHTEDDALRALGSRPTSPEDDEPAPWAKRLGEILNAGDDGGSTPIEIFHRDAIHRLGPCRSLTPSALATLEDRLRLNLNGLIGRPLKAAGEGIRPADFFREYSVSARYVVRLCDTWIESTRELDRRLAADRDLLAEHFGADGELTGLRVGLSDRHHGGRQVCELQFTSGTSVMYKPRKLDAEVAFQSLLHHVSTDLGEATPPTLRICPRDGYGWMETAVHAPVTDLEQARLVFQRAGSLLFLTWLLGIDDLHMGNVVATADGPIVVDLETVLQCSPGRGPDAGSSEGALRRARRRLDDSFLSTGLLSFHRQDAQGRFFEIGGLLGSGEHNRFQLQGEDLRPEDFSDEIEQGFERAYRTMISQTVPPQQTVTPQAVPRSAVPRPQSPFGGPPHGRPSHGRPPHGRPPHGRHHEAWTELLGSVRPRRVLRSSQGYAYLLGRLTSLENLRDGFTAGLVLELLEGHPDEVHAEKASLQALDIPAFDGDPHQGFAAMLKRWRGLDEPGLRRQKEILRAALGPRKSTSPSRGERRTDGSEKVDGLSVALGFAQRLRDAAILGGDGAATWLTTSSVRITGRRDRGMSYHLYDGGVGISVFLAALARITGDPDWAALALAGLKPIEAVLASPRRDELIRRETLGAGSGLGSIVYGTTLVSRFLNEPQALETARRTAELITPERIAKDDRFDVEGGAAGAILGLRALHRADSQAWIRERMAVCAEHVVDRLGSAAETIPPGFAHGASGMAYALLAMADVDASSRWSTAARDALLLERPFYDPERKNWVAVDGTARNAWCHGAPGIALARFAAHGRIPEPWVESELRTAVGTTLRGAKIALDADSEPTVEHLCCGRFGRLDLLLEAGRRFDRSDLVDAARSVARQRLQAQIRFAEEESYGFFRGISGLGYTLLRLREETGEQVLPSVLAFDPMEETS